MMNSTRYSSIANIALGGVFVIVGLLGMTSFSLAQGDTWTEKSAMPTARLTFTTAVVGGKIYAIGGHRTETVPLSKVEVYDPATDTWDTNRTDMPTARDTNLGCAVVDGKIYIIGGGLTNRSARSTVEMYDPATDTWTGKAPMPTARALVSTCVVSGKIYAIGGTTTGVAGSIWEGLSTVEEYDPATDTWTTKDSMPTKRWGLAASVVDGKLYAIGGNVTDLQYTLPTIVPTVEMYDPATDTWTKKADMPTARYGHAASVIDGRIYVVGGFLSTGSGPLYKTVEEYDPVTDTWARKSDMPTAIAALSTAVVDGKLYAIGGTITTHPFVSVGNVYEYNPDVTVSVEESISGPETFALHQNFPNPFNPETRIRYEVSKQARVVLKIINLLGQAVRTLVDEEKPAGPYELSWDGKDNHGHQVASGVYLYRLETRDFVQTRKMVLLQ